MGSSMGRDLARVTASNPSGFKASIIATAGEDFVESTSVKELLRIPDATMNQIMTIAYQLYVSRRLVEAEIVCKGLIACDHRHWWSHSLHASLLRRLGREQEALQAVKQGLKYAPAQPKLLLMHDELLTTIDRKRSRLQPVGPEQPADSLTAPNDHASIAGRSSNGGRT